MNLIIDIGNTTQKIALIENEEIVLTARLSGHEAMLRFFSDMKNRADKAIISTVRDIPGDLLSKVEEVSGYVHQLSHKSSLPFTIDYETPETLGMDRIAGVAGAYNKYGDRSVLVIDAGTAVTYDVLNRGTFHGGAISPGVDLRFRALSSFTGRLPRVERAEEAVFPARSTRSAINCGVVNGIVFEINEYIRTFKKIYPDGLVLMTGGDAEFLAAKTVSRPEVDADLVTRGLNFILNYNAH